MANVRISDIPTSDRPRERMINIGPNALSNEELIALIFKSGTKDKSAKNLSSELLKQVGGVKNLKNITLEELKQIKGIGNAKGTSLLAAIELGKRINREIDTVNDLKITNSKIIYDYYKNIIGDKLQEYFYCVYLDNQKRIIKDKLLFIGTLNRSLVHPREVFKEAYVLSASCIICVHNHPSGEVLPSADDLNLTSKLVEIGYLLGIPIIDHVIIGQKNYYSFYENHHIQ